MWLLLLTMTTSSIDRAARPSSMWTMSQPSSSFAACCIAIGTAAVGETDCGPGAGRTLGTAEGAEVEGGAGVVGSIAST